MDGSVANKAYKVNKTLNCNDRGIYVVTGGCEQQYSSKTTTPYSNKTCKHFTKITGTIFTHKQKCGKCVDLCNCSISMVTITWIGESIAYRRGNTCGTVEFRIHLTFKKTLNSQ